MSVAEGSLLGMTKPIWFSYLLFEMSGIGLLYQLQSTSMPCSFLPYYDEHFVVPIKHRPRSALEYFSAMLVSLLWTLAFTFCKLMGFSCTSSMSFCYHQYSCDGSESTISYSLLLTGFFFSFWMNTPCMWGVLMTSRTDIAIFLFLLTGGRTDIDSLITWIAQLVSSALFMSRLNL